MGLSYQPKAITLSFKEGKPVTYKAQQVTYPTIKSKDLLAYAANAANVPLANIECCVQGLIEAINYFVLNGHAVQLEGLGSFSPRINSKTTQNPDEVGAEPSRQCHSPTWHHRQDEGTAQTEGQQPPRLRVFVIPR